MDSNKSENSGPLDEDGARQAGATFLRVRFLEDEASSTPVILTEMPPEVRTGVDQVAQALLDPDGGRVLMIGYPLSGKSFLIEQLARNIDFYLEKTAIKSMIFIQLSVADWQLIEQLPGRYNTYVEFLTNRLEVTEAELCFVVEHVEVAAAITMSSGGAKIILETNVSNFLQLSHTESNGQTKLWSSWNIVDANNVYCSKASLVETLHQGMHDKLLESLSVDISRKHLLMLINYFLKRIPQLKGEDEQEGLILAAPGFWAATVRRLALALAFDSRSELHNTKKQIVFTRVLAHVYEEMGETFEELLEAGSGGGSSDDGVQEAQRQLLEQLGLRMVTVGAPEPTTDDEEDGAPATFKAIAKLPERLKKEIFGQDSAVEAVADSFLAPAAGLSGEDKPVRSLIFLGPTGVGKTKLALTLAEELFDEPLNVVRLDMSEYSQRHEAVKLLGAPPGYVGHGRGGVLTNAVKAHPRSLILLDEVEKAHPDIWDSFLQVLDAGRMTDGDGEVVDFTQTVIVMTSNLGSAELNKHSFGFSTGNAEEQYQARTAHAASSVKKALAEFFKPEFLNRIDDQIFFQELSEATTKEIVHTEIALIAERAKEKGFKLAKPKDDILIEVLKQADVTKYGAREIQRVVRRTISNQVARHMLVPDTSKKKLSLTLVESKGITVTAK